MSSTAVRAGMAWPAADSEVPRDSRYLHGPVLDFLLLGGSSFLALPILLLLPVDKYMGIVAVAALALANVINHPHFAHSYQIFYGGFADKLFGTSLNTQMRMRYAIAGIVVPLLLVAFFAVGLLSGNVRLVTWGGNIMALFVGWHYVKQGYGMLMVDSVLKRRFFSDLEKRILLINAYAVWATAWLYVNSAGVTTDLWDLKYYAIPVPAWSFYSAVIAVAASSIAAAFMLWRKHKGGGRLPLTGLMAYFVTLYLWSLFAWINPLWLLVIPVLHSLQYLAVVYRFQLNVERAKPATTASGFRATFGSLRVRMTLFATIGFVLGALLFWAIPLWLDAETISTDALFGPSLFLFVCWVTVNVHHYFMDSVMWRRDNPKVKQHLFC
jgi:hypothetical protein